MAPAARHWTPSTGEHRYFTTQAGRADRSKFEDEPWGTTSNQSHFKAYEASDARNARSLPSQVRPCQENKTGLALGPLQIWERHREDYPALKTPSEASGGKKYIPAAELVHMRPIPERPFGGVSHYTQHQAAAQEARHDYFPYRDEFHPRSKRLLYEMALNAVDDRKSNVSEETRSCFTLPSSVKSHKSQSTEKSVASQPRSLSSSRLPTGDSLRVGGGKPGALAHRRAQAFFRSPSQSHVDREWYVSMNEKEGPAAICTTNYRPRFYKDSLDTYSQALAEMSALLDGERETQPRTRTNK